MLSVGAVSYSGLQLFAHWHKHGQNIEPMDQYNIHQNVQIGVSKMQISVFQGGSTHVIFFNGQRFEFWQSHQT